MEAEAPFRGLARYRRPVAWQWLLIFYFLSTALHGVALTVCQLRSTTPPVWLTLAHAIRSGGIPDDWPRYALPFVAVHESLNLLAIFLSVVVVLQPRRASACLAVYSLTLAMEVMLRAGVWWSQSGVRIHGTGLRITETLGLLCSLTLPLAWLWYAGRAAAFRHPLRAFIAVTLVGYGGEAAVRLLADGAAALMVRRLASGYLLHRTMPMALSALVLLLLALAVVKRPRAVRTWLVLLPIAILAAVIPGALPAWYNRYFVNGFDLAALMLTPLLYLTQVFAAFVLVPRELFRPDDAPVCLTCGYNLTGNVSGVCPECGIGVTAP